MKGILRNNNYLSLFLILIGLMFFLEAIFSVAGSILVMPVLGLDDLKTAQRLLTNPGVNDLADPSVLFAIKLLNMMVALGKFIFGSMLFIYLTSGHRMHFFGHPPQIPLDSSHKEAGPLKSSAYFGSISPLAVLFALGALLVSGPLIGWVYEWNQQIVFPEFMSGFEQFARETEDKIQLITDAILGTTNFMDLAVNLLILGVIAAVGEEIFFRGVLQNMLISWTGKPHFGIWTSAFLFSLMHIQFYGFFARLLLGVLFGYFAWASRSLWIPILMHLVNNSMLIIYQFLVSKGVVEDNLQMNSTLVALLSILPLTAFLYLYFRQNKRFFANRHYGEKMGQNIQHGSGS